MYLVQAQPAAEALADERAGTFGPIATAIGQLARPPRRLFKQGRRRYSFRRFVGSVLPQQLHVTESLGWGSPNGPEMHSSVEKGWSGSMSMAIRNAASPKHSCCCRRWRKAGGADKKLDCFISSGRGSDDTRPG